MYNIVCRAQLKGRNSHFALKSKTLFKLTLNIKTWVVGKSKKKIYTRKILMKRAGMALITSEKVAFRVNNITKNKYGYSKW